MVGKERKTKTDVESRRVAVRAVKTDTVRQLRHQLNISDDILRTTKKKSTHESYTTSNPPNRGEKDPPKLFPESGDWIPLGVYANPGRLLQRVVLRRLARIFRVRVRVRVRRRRGGYIEGSVLIRGGDTNECEEADYGV